MDFSSFDTSFSGIGSFRNAAHSFSAKSSSVARSANASLPYTQPKLAQPPRFYEQYALSSASSSPGARFDLDPPAHSRYSRGTPHDADDSITVGTLASVSPLDQHHLSLADGVGGDAGPGIDPGLGPPISRDEQLRLIEEIKADLDTGNGTFVDRFFGDVGIAELAKLMKDNTSVKALDLRGNRIGAIGAVALAKMLKENSSLEALCVEWNSLGSDVGSFEALAAAIGESASLRTVDLRNNRLSDQCALALFRALKFNTSIHTVDLRWNNITHVLVSTIIDTLRHNQTIDTLQLSGNALQTASLDRINAALARGSNANDTSPAPSTPAKRVGRELLETGTPISPLPGPRSAQQRNFDSSMSNVDKTLDEQDRRLASAGGEPRSLPNPEIEAAKKQIDAELQEKADAMVVENAKFMARQQVQSLELNNRQLQQELSAAQEQKHKVCV